MIICLIPSWSEGATGEIRYWAGTSDWRTSRWPGRVRQNYLCTCGPERIVNLTDKYMMMNIPLCFFKAPPTFSLTLRVTCRRGGATLTGETAGVTGVFHVSDWREKLSVCWPTLFFFFYPEEDAASGNTLSQRATANRCTHTHTHTRGVFITWTENQKK